MSTRPEEDSLVAELVDRSMASLPSDKYRVDYALKLKYVFNESNRNASEKVHTSETQYRELLRVGEVWVESFLTCIKQSAHCPKQLKEFFDLVKKGMI